MPVNKYPQVLLIGDSILQFGGLLRDGFSFEAGLAEYCARRLDVVNRGLSGYTTANILLILEDLIPSPSSAKVDYIILLLGSNDACLPDSPSGQHVDLGKFQEYLEDIITHPAVKAHNPTILLVTPPPINEVHLQEQDLLKGSTALTRRQEVMCRYVNVVAGLAFDYADEKVILVNLWEALVEEAHTLTSGSARGGKLIGTLEAGDNAGLRLLLADGLHLTAAGYKVFLDAVLPHVGSWWAEEPADNPKWVFPHWSIAPRIDR